ncbi:RhoGEF domain containing protein [Entamoeba histolytica HM-1:IMSS-B]|uniref:DH domain-containing protein n=7 Tax=Entamoeba TaxID=5758 RepID=A0A175JWE6_ENTHI|nr:guanine nucleotide exchange factor, putative [Entamoeba histolytica KU27]EMH75074.1 RhoGEF domain containing protein [Entamoeba histolytica HM-1:IMSS-B]EMS13030.1 guanine nucleotide exchange factor, putative [Entamoeba histolytica HM-3:IMSS]ENY65941.1 guanine nucleotide exchange factor, putative [Entamoeba histolytica HM-1:IMSS-A]GAT97987.1 hypothetical protein CL6EHI_053620 [Entamoeba histolytica]
MSNENESCEKEKKVGKHQPGKSLVEEFIPFKMEVSPFKPRLYSYWMDASRWSSKMLEKMLIKKDMRGIGNRMKILSVTGPEFMKIDSKFNVKLGAELQEWRNLLAYRDECRKASAACILQRAIRSRQKVKDSKKYIYCSKIVNEIISTEQTYVQQLDVVVDLIMKPLKKINKQEEIITEEQMKLIFYGLANIQATNHALLDNLIESCTNYSQKTCVGKIFLEFTPFLKMYSDYCRIYNNISDMVCVTLKPPHPFAKFIGDQMKHAPVGLRHHTLTSLLITPVQRLPRYKLLLTDLLRHYNWEHPDYYDLKKAQEEVNKVATYVNEMSRMQESTEMTLYLTNITKGVPEGLNICEPGRIFMSRNDVTLYETIIKTHTVMISDASNEAEDYCDIDGDHNLVQKEVDFPEIVESQVTVVLFNDIVLLLTADVAASIWNVGLKLFSSVGLAKEQKYEGFYYYKHFKLCKVNIEKAQETCVQIEFNEKELKSMQLKFIDEKTRDDWFEIAVDYCEQQKKLEKSLEERRNGLFLRNIQDEILRRNTSKK